MQVNAGFRFRFGRWTTVALVTAFSVVACDFGNASGTEKDVGPPIQIRSSARNEALAADGTIAIELDRLLDPQSINADSIVVVGADNRSIDATRAYDPVRRVVRLYSPMGEGNAWLTVGQTIRVRLLGVEAIDKARLADNAPRELTFNVMLGPTGTSKPPAISFCTDVLPVFQTKCAGSTCHSLPTSSGLNLDTPIGIANTAVARVAQSSNTGVRAGIGSGRAFGIDMAVIDPGKPGTSWLLYKTLLSGAPRANAATPIARPNSCGGTPRAPTTVSAFGAALEDAERARLSDFVTGQAMPYPTFDRDGKPIFDSIGVADLDRIRLWIEQGAAVRDCSQCEP